MLLLVCLLVWSVNLLKTCPKQVISSKELYIWNFCGWIISVVIRSSFSSLITFNTSIKILILAVHEFYINRLMDCKWKKLHVCFNLFSPTGFLMKLEGLMNVMDMFYQDIFHVHIEFRLLFSVTFGRRIHSCFFFRLLFSTGKSFFLHFLGQHYSTFLGATSNLSHSWRRKSEDFGR